MSNYIVEHRETGAVVYSYSADCATDFSEYPFAQFNHILQKADKIKSERMVSGVAFLRRFTQDQRIAIRALATSVPQVDDFLRLLDTTIAQAGTVDLDDSDTIAGVNTLVTLLPEQGINPAVILA